MTHLEIIYQDADLVAINKPHGLLVHKTRIAADATEFAVQILRNQIGQHVYPVHRLDRKTSGALLFAKNTKVNSDLQQLFRERRITKSYIAVVRGWLPESGNIDYALSDHKGIYRESITSYKRIRQFEVDLPLNGFKTSRYSLVELSPKTGRHHQLRKHMAHILHPIIGDRPHGCNKQNKLWKDQYNMTDMLLSSTTLHFEYPQGVQRKIESPVSDTLQQTVDLMEKLQI